METSKLLAGEVTLGEVTSVFSLCDTIEIFLASDRMPKRSYNMASMFQICGRTDSKQGST